jgi:photosystem II stability/assembly factor-like uncharacterized protein
MRALNKLILKYVFLLVVLLQPSFQLVAQSHWRALTPQTANTLYKLSFLDSLRGWVAGFQGTILRTTNGGLTWQTQNSGITNDIHDIFMLNDRLGWALAFEHFVDTATWYGTKILKTTNGGTTWTNEQYSKSGEFFNAVFYMDSLRGWMAGEFGRMVRTSNAGVTWVPVEVDPSPYTQWGLVNVKFFTPRYGFAMGGRIDIIGVVWRTTDGGIRWKASQVSPEPAHDMYMLDSLHLVAIVGDVDYGASMIRTRDGGETWEYTFLNIFGLPQALSFRTRYEAWAPLGFEGRLMYTLDTAHTWTTLDTPLRRPVYDLVFTDSLTGYAVGDSGMVLKFKLPTVHVAEPALLPPAGFALHQNYPNPFNPSTTISFDLPEQSVVTVKVFDVLGREVRTLLSQHKEPGRHYVSFDGRGLPTGVYFYSLHAGRFSAVRKMMLVE